MKISLDFETYSEAGYTRQGSKWVGGGLSDVGAIRYAQHPSTRILCLAYSVFGEIKLWTPDQSFPEELKNHIENNCTLEAWNVFFERAIWLYVGVLKYDFPPVKPNQWSCTMARARAYGLPGSLDKCAQVLGTKNQKDKIGETLIKKLCIPTFSPVTLDDYTQLHEYCAKDVLTESEISTKIPQLSDSEKNFWQSDQQINWRGVQVDFPTVKNLIHLVDLAEQESKKSLSELTGGVVNSPFETQRILKIIAEEGMEMTDLTKKSVKNALITPGVLTDKIESILKIRESSSLTSLKKLRAIESMATSDERVHNLFLYHGARTGRAKGVKIQPQNLPSSPQKPVYYCVKCERYTTKKNCPNCFNLDIQKKSWSFDIAEKILHDVNTFKDLTQLNYLYGDLIALLPGCLRSLFTAAPGKVLIGADYSAIEAVVLAALSGEEWRLEVFRTHGMIYEESASRITGVPLSEFIEYKKRTGEDHPLRKKIGKVAELASGYQGWVGAWKAFGADEHLTEDEIVTAVKAWRDASPNIVNFWRGLENCARLAILYPGTTHQYRSIQYEILNGNLHCVLPSGRRMVYWRPKIIGDQIHYETWNTNAAHGKIGWTQLQTYGGKLTENVVQAVARDILAFAIMGLEENGFPVVLHVHDEIVCEIPENRIDTEKYKKIMTTKPVWASKYPLNIGEVWVGKRYRK